MTIDILMLLILLGVVVGAVGTLVGAGGGFILTPILLLLYPSDSLQTITGISLVTVFFNAVSGSGAYGWMRRIDYRSGLIFAVATLPGSVAGVLVVEAASRRLFDVFMAVLLGGLAIWLLVGRPESSEGVPRPGWTSRQITDRAGKTHHYSVPLRRGAFWSVGVGFVSAFLGIGGGIAHVPLLVQALGFPVHVATATSHFILAIMAGTASATHILTGGLNHGHGLRRALSLSIGVVVGAQVGARLSTRVGDRLIQRVLAASLGVLAVRLIIGAF